MKNSNSNDDNNNQASPDQTEPKDGVTRRRFMTLFGGGVASMAVTACGGGGSAGDVQSASQLAMMTLGGRKPTTPTPPPTTDPGTPTTPPPTTPPPTTPPPTTTPTPPVTGLPSWVPPVGYFADVPMVNNPQDVMPDMYRSSAGDTSAMDQPFIMWGGSAILRDYSALGAQVYYAGGHEPAGWYPNIQLSLICDFSTLTWSVANLPTQANPSSTFVNGYAPDGTPYTPHTYLGLQEMPKSWGGGMKGTLVSFLWAGLPYDGKINLLDVSSATNGYSRLVTRQLQNADPTEIRFDANTQGGNYPITVMDETRQGWWLAVQGGVQYTLFVSKTGDITQYPALGGNLADGSMVLANSLNLLIAIDGGYNIAPYTGYRTIYIRDLTTNTVTQSTTAGPVPSLGAGYDGSPDTYNRANALGLQWVDELGCIVGFDQSTSPPSIVKLTPPASNPATGTWTWSRVAVQHWGQDTSGQTTLQTCLNNVWSKFRWVPSLHAFVYGTGKDRKPQIVRIA